MNDRLSNACVNGEETRCSEFDMMNSSNRRERELMQKKKLMNHSSSRSAKGDESQLHCHYYSPSVMYDPPHLSPASSVLCKLHYGNSSPANQYNSCSSKKYLNACCNHQYQAEARYNNYNEESNAFYIPKSASSANNPQSQPTPPPPPPASSSHLSRHSPPQPALRIYNHKPQQFINDASTQGQSQTNSAPPTTSAHQPQTSEINEAQNTINRNNSNNMSEISVMLKSNIAVCLEVENIATVSCRDLINMMIEEPEVGLAPGDGEMFALWMVSSLFEVQLKPDHKPNNVWKKWPNLLAKYTCATELEREKDCPHLNLQRDVFFPKREEIRLGNCLALELIYEEAKWNIVRGRYPCDQNSALRLAGLQARIDLGKYDPEIHTPEYFKSRLNLYLPASACKSKWSILNFGSKSGLEYRLLLQFRAFQDDVSRHTFIRQYMDFCWNLLFYGSAFFTGQLETPVQGLAALIGYQDKPVTVAINSEGVTIISTLESKVLLGLRYQDLSWDSARPSNENNPDCLPCLFLQFQLLEAGQRVFKVLQVFSKQAILMDAIISSFVRALRQSWDRDEVDYSIATSPGDCTPDADDAHTPLTTSSLYGSTLNDADSNLSNLQRLSLATFNEDGDCIKLMGSWAFRANN